jgi:hypothetical protein
MHNQDIIEMATWLQGKFSDKSEDPLLRRHMKNWSRRSYPISLNEKLPVEIVYQTAEVQGDELILHPDIYRYRDDYYQDLEVPLAKIGVPLSEIDFDRLPEMLPGKESVRIPILSILLVKHTLACHSPTQDAKGRC